MKRFVTYWALAGVLIPILLYSVRFLFHPRFNPYLIVAMWPSSILTMGAQNAGALGGSVIVLIAIVINAVLYSVIGALIWWVMRCFK